ncbi:hypothetical protein H4J58_17340 [Colwellia sp. MB3u-70]|uniref:hypothetical protein n=1 Tax=unclassified Colwellia TaxID=196834 RepID=UPI0015F6DB2D|nr:MULTISPECIES: hypothetical protein [unclassified Colwellia]MBA6293694.1 hypothetical protein [Colwellia sp. MB3u-8]MBA6308879.1 hypothetical protein [Colwellia sp. MB3u-70]
MAHSRLKAWSYFPSGEVRVFYDNDNNSVGFVCSQSPILVNTNTGEVLQNPLIKRMQKAREKYQNKKFN